MSLEYSPARERKRGPPSPFAYRIIDPRRTGRAAACDADDDNEVLPEMGPAPGLHRRPHSVSRRPDHRVGAPRDGRRVEDVVPARRAGVRLRKGRADRHRFRRAAPSKGGARIQRAALPAFGRRCRVAEAKAASIADRSQPPPRRRRHRQGEGGQISATSAASAASSSTAKAPHRALLALRRHRPLFHLDPQGAFLCPTAFEGRRRHDRVGDVPRRCWLPRSGREVDRQAGPFRERHGEACEGDCGHHRAIRIRALHLERGR